MVKKLNFIEQLCPTEEKVEKNCLNLEILTHRYYLFMYLQMSLF